MHLIKITWPIPLVLSLLLLATGCGTLTVRSSPPEADVGIILPGRETPKMIGQTPYSASFSELKDSVNQGTVVVVVQKRGYIPQKFVIPNLGSGNLELEASLLPNLPSNYQEVNRVVALTLRAERLILEQRFDEALEVASEIKGINENVASAFEIEGTVHFLQREFDKSRFAWIRALELDPNNPEGQSMLTRVEEQLSGQNPLTNE